MAVALPPPLSWASILALVPPSATASGAAPRRGPTACPPFPPPCWSSHRCVVSPPPPFLPV
eukprot:6670895-Lingulodinium_polyedra.AAC.1